MGLGTYAADKTEEMLKAHPRVAWFVLTIGICCIVVALIISNFIFATKASADDHTKEASERFDIIERDVSLLKDEVVMVQEYLESSARQDRLDSLVIQIQNIEAEIYNLERLDDNGEANQRDINRLDSLRIRRDELVRRRVEIVGPGTNAGSRSEL